MKTHMLQTSFKVRTSPADYEDLREQFAPNNGAGLGLVWNAWLFNETRNEGGGVYLFESREALRAFVDGPIIAQARKNPALESFTLKTLDVLDGPNLEVLTKALGEREHW